ncbi:hypothetical protein T492DRAFT_864122 [Pavlovales sp. CCMP2436]|nr:hypothetical protein T492DRAFT_864122 [Pavlovales sp. CCMP2436]
MLSAKGVGCVAEVTGVAELPDGRLQVEVVGRDRFVLERSWIAPFAFGLRVGAVRTYADRPDAPSAAAAEGSDAPSAAAAGSSDAPSAAAAGSAPAEPQRAGGGGARPERKQVQQLLDRLAREGGELASQLPFLAAFPPERLQALSDESLSFALSDLLPVHPSVKRQWLRSQSTAQRLSAHAALLAQVLAEVSAAAERGQVIVAAGSGAPAGPDAPPPK